MESNSEHIVQNDPVLDKTGLSRDRIREIFNEQVDKNYWNFYDERAHLEEMLNSRFNFYIAFYAAILAFATTCSSFLLASFVLAFGSIATFIITLATQRIYVKLLISLQVLYSLGENHCLPVTRLIMNYKTNHHATKRFKWLNKLALRGLDSNEYLGFSMQISGALFLFVLSIVVFILNFN